MSLATLSGELDAELEHTIDRILDRVESLGLDPHSEDVMGYIEDVFGGTVLNQYLDQVV